MIAISNNIIRGDLEFPCQALGNVTEPAQFAEEIYRFLNSIRGRKISPEEFARGIFESFARAGKILAHHAIVLLEYIIIFFSYNLAQKTADAVKNEFLVLLNQPNTSSS